MISPERLDRMSVNSPTAFILFPATATAPLSIGGPSMVTTVRARRIMISLSGRLPLAFDYFAALVKQEITGFLTKERNMTPGDGISPASLSLVILRIEFFRRQFAR